MLWRKAQQSSRLRCRVQQVCPGVRHCLEPYWYGSYTLCAKAESTASKTNNQIIKMFASSWRPNATTANSVIPGISIVSSSFRQMCSNVYVTNHHLHGFDNRGGHVWTQQNKRHINSIQRKRKTTQGFIHAPTCNHNIDVDSTIRFDDFVLLPAATLIFPRHVVSKNYTLSLVGTINNFKHITCKVFWNILSFQKCAQ